MPEQTTAAPSGAVTESAAPISTPVQSDAAGSSGTQPESTGIGSPQQEASPSPSTDWRSRETEDPSLKQYIQDAISRARAADRKKAQRDRAKQAVESNDANSALDVARQIASEDDPDEARQASLITAAASATESVKGLTGTDEYAELWDKYGQAEMNRRFWDDPTKFAAWVSDEVMERRVTKRAEKMAKEIARAMATEQTSDALRNIPQPIAGVTSGGGSLTLERYLAMPHAERMKLKKDNPELVNALTTQAQYE